jgi:RNA polymerase sigma-70 factor (ECF subfamily)
MTSSGIACAEIGVFQSFTTTSVSDEHSGDGDNSAAVLAGLDETELIRLARAGVHEAFGVITRRCNQRLFRVARSVLHDDVEAEDAVQEAYARAFQKLSGFRGDSSLLTWMTRITLNEARGRLRRRKHVVDLDTVTPDQLLSSCPPERDPEAEAARSEARHLIEIAIDELPEPFRLVFIMRDVEDCSVEETAAALHLRTPTVNTRLHRARRILRTMLQNEMAPMLTGAFPFLGNRCLRMTGKVLSTLERGSVNRFE